MKAKVQLLKKQRIFSEDYKKEIVTLFESGKYSVLQLSKLYAIATPVIYRWIHKFSTLNEKGARIVEMKESSSKKLEDLLNKVKELEQIVGKKQIKIDYLEKMMDLAEEEYSIDIKKNSNTSQSTGSKKTKRK